MCLFQLETGMSSSPYGQLPQTDDLFDSSMTDPLDPIATNDDNAGKNVMSEADGINLMVQNQNLSIVN